jgi:hypothetical protein
MIKYSQNVLPSQTQERNAHVSKAALTGNWLFENAQHCLRLEQTQKILNNIPFMKQFSVSENEADNLSILVAVLQYFKIRNSTNTAVQHSFKQDARFSAENPLKIDLLAEILMQLFETKSSQVEAVDWYHEENFVLRNWLDAYITIKEPCPQYILTHDAATDNEWEYVIIVMMKRKLMRIPKPEEKQPTTVAQAVSDSYNHSCDMICRLCSNTRIVNDRQTACKKLIATFKDGRIPDENFSISSIDKKPSIVSVVEEWYTWFLVQRVFSRRIAAILTEIGQEDLTKKLKSSSQTKDVDLMLGSVDTTYEFDVPLFANQCLKMEKDYLFSDFRETCRRFPFEDTIVKNVSAIASNSNIVYREEINKVLRIDTNFLGQFLTSLFRCFSVPFNPNGRIDSSLTTLSNPTKPGFRKYEFLQFVRHDLENRKSPPGRRTATTTPGRGTFLAPSEREEGESDIDTDTLIKIWKNFDNTIEDFVDSFNDYNIRNIDRTQKQKEACELRLVNLIYRNLGVTVDIGNVHIPTKLLVILKNLTTPATYHLSLPSVVEIMSNNYSYNSNIGTHRPLSSHPKNQESWNGWCNQFNFFMALLLACIMYDMSRTTSSKRDEAYNIEMFMLDLAADNDPKQTQILTHDECQRYMCRYRCYELLLEVFDQPITANIKSKRYTMNHIMGLISEKHRTDASTVGYYKGLIDKSNSLFEWRRDGYSELLNEKNIVEHLLCLIMNLFGVNNLPSVIMYNDVSPPPKTSTSPQHDSSSTKKKTEEQVEEEKLSPDEIKGPWRNNRMIGPDQKTDTPAKTGGEAANPGFWERLMTPKKKTKNPEDEIAPKKDSNGRNEIDPDADYV